MNNACLYDAFISYRHLSPDMEVAERLQKLIENYRPPKGVAKKGGFRVFRDKSELPTSGDLGESLRNALVNSAYLIVVISEHTMESKWCMEEIRTFKAACGNRVNRIFPVLVSGEPAAVLPPELRFETVWTAMPDGTAAWNQREVEPLCCDVRAGSSGKRRKLLNTEFLRLMAPMLNCRFDDLYQRKKRRQRKIRAALFSGAFALLTAAVTVVSAFLIREGRLNRNLQEKNQEVLEKNQEVLEKNQEVENKNREIQESLASSYALFGSEASEAGEYQNSLMYFAEALKADPSNERARIGAYCTLTSWYWPVLTETRVAEADEKKLYEPPQEASGWGELICTPSEDLLGSEVGANFYGYQDGNTLTVFDAETNTAVRIPVPEKRREDYTTYRRWSKHGVSNIRLFRGNTAGMLYLPFEGDVYVYEYRFDPKGAFAKTSGSLIHWVDADEAFSILSQKEFDYNTYENYHEYGSYNKIWISFDGTKIAVEACDDKYSSDGESINPALAIYDMTEKKWSFLESFNEDCYIENVVFNPNNNGFTVVGLIDNVYSSDPGLCFHIFDHGQKKTTISRSYGFKTQNYEYSDDGSLFLICKRNGIMILDGVVGTTKCPDIQTNDNCVSAHFVEGGLTVTNNKGEQKIYKLLLLETKAQKPDDSESKIVEARGYQGDFCQKLGKDWSLFIGFDYDYDSTSDKETTTITVRLLDQNNAVLDAFEFTLSGANVWEYYVQFNKNDNTGYCGSEKDNGFFRFTVDSKKRTFTNVEMIYLGAYQLSRFYAVDGGCVIKSSASEFLFYPIEGKTPSGTFRVDLNEDLEYVEFAGYVPASNGLGVAGIYLYATETNNEAKSYLWDFENGDCLCRTGIQEKHLSNPARNCTLDYTLSPGGGTVYEYLLEHEPDEAAVELLLNLAACGLDKDQSAAYKDPAFTGDLGMYGALLTVSGVWE